MGEPATVEWSSHEIALVERETMDVDDDEIEIDEGTLMLPPPASSTSRARVADRTLVMTPASGVRRVVRRTRPRVVELAVLASLFVIGFAVGLACVAALCAAAQRPWL